MMGDRCKSCGAAIRWAVSENGRAMPIDAAPTPSGNIHLIERFGRTTAVVRRVGELDLAPDGERYTSHFATCPNAEQHRRTRSS